MEDRTSEADFLDIDIQGGLHHRLVVIEHTLTRKLGSHMDIANI